MNDYLGAMGTAIYSTLTGGTALIAALGGTAVYNQQAPDGAALPYVVFSHQGGGPENMTGGADLRNNIWYVRAYAASAASAANIDGKCSALLHRKTLTVTVGTNIWTAREEDIAIVENPPDGSRVYSAGGLYRVRITGV